MSTWNDGTPERATHQPSGHSREYWPDRRWCDEAKAHFLATGLDRLMPRHRGSPNCQSGKRPHCTCDTCF